MLKAIQNFNSSPDHLYVTNFELLAQNDSEQNKSNFSLLHSILHLLFTLLQLNHLKLHHIICLLFLSLYCLITKLSLFLTIYLYLYFYLQYFKFMNLSQQQRIKFANIIFDSKRRQKYHIDQLSIEELQILRSIYAQKIAFQTINGKIPDRHRYQKEEPFKEDSENTSLCTNIFCCCFPQSNREMFQITTDQFLKRAFYPIFFWNSDFFNIGQYELQYYGYTWMLVAYTAVLMLSSTLTGFFVDPIKFQKDYQLLITCMGVASLFKLIEPLIHSSVIDCLGNRITTDQCMMISGYSLVIYFIPTLFCMVPSEYWKLIMLLYAGLSRAIFLTRNYSNRIQARVYLMFIVLIFIQLIYLVVLFRGIFAQSSLGFGFQQGFAAVFGTTATPAQQVQSQNPLSSLQNNHQSRLHFRTMRHFQV